MITKLFTKLNLFYKLLKDKQIDEKSYWLKKILGKKNDDLISIKYKYMLPSLISISKFWIDNSAENIEDKFLDKTLIMFSDTINEVK